MSQNPILIGAGGALLGAIITSLATSQGPDMRRLESKLDEQAAALSATSDGLAAEIAALTEKVDLVDANVAAAAQATSGVGENLLSSMGDLSQSVTDTLAQNADTQSALLESGLTELQSLQAEAQSAVATAIAAATPDAVATQEDAAATPVADATQEDTAEAEAPTVAQDTAEAEDAEQTEMPAANSPSAGETVALADGALRAFVSRVTPEGARLAINGLSMIELAPAQTRGIQTADAFCRIALDSVGGGQAGLSALCGDDLPPPVGTKTAETAMLADGAVRAFVSRISGDESYAVVAFNGLETVPLDFGEIARIDTDGGECEVKIDGIDRGHVAFTASCD